MGSVAKEQLRQGFWSSTSGLVKGVGTLFGSIAALITVLLQLGLVGPPGSGSKDEGDGGTASAFIRSLDALLQNSADTRGQLGPLIAAVNAEPPTLTEREARSRIDEIVSQRQSLRNTVAAMTTPAEFSRAARMLVSSIAAALEDDRVLRSWIDARYSGDEDRARRLWSKQVAASAEATRLKETFRTEYNTLRGELRLPPFTASY